MSDIIKLKNNPLEAIFNLAPGDLGEPEKPEGAGTPPTEVIDDYIMTTEGALHTVPQAQPPTYVDDSEDKDITKKIDAVYDKAMEGYDNQAGYAEIVEPRYAARNAEVAATYLNVALNAVATKGRVKEGKRRAGTPHSFVMKKTVNNVVADRNDILRMLEAQRKEEDQKSREGH